MSGTGLGRLAPVVAMGLLIVTAIIVQMSPTPGDARRSGATESDAMMLAASGEQATGEAATRAAPAAQAPSQIAAARRGTIVEMVTLNGRIGATEEQALSFRTPQRIATVSVKPGDLVETGQVLAKADERELARSLAGARERLTSAATKLTQAEELLATQQQAVERRQELTRLRGQRSVSAAEAALRRAEADYARTQAGASASERRAAETAVASARAGVARAQADLVRLQQGADGLELRQAEQQVVLAQQALKRAMEEAQRLEQGPDPVALRAAERDYLSAQNVATRAQLDLARLVQPDPATLSAAEREVQRAETALRLAQMSPSSSKSGEKTDKNSERRAQAERQAAIQNARLTLQTAQERLRAIQAGPPPGELAVAQRNLVTARSALESARERLELVKQGPDASSLAQAKIAVDSARLAFESAAARLSTLQAGPDPEQLSATTAAYQSAQSALRSAETQQAEVLARPTRAELAAAEDGLNAARETLDQVRAEAEILPDETPTDQAPGDLMLLRQSVEQEQSAVRALENDLMNAQLTAPGPGVVIAVMAREGSGADAGQPVVILARQDSTPLVLADVPTADGARLVAGQRAIIQYSGLAGDPLESVLDRVVAPVGGLVRVEMRPAWPPELPVLGSPASIQVVLQERADVVIVPERALRGAGSQRTVEIQDGDERRNVPVEVGLIANGDAEIVAGLESGINVTITP